MFLILSPRHMEVVLCSQNLQQSPPRLPVLWGQARRAPTQALKQQNLLQPLRAQSSARHSCMSPPHLKMCTLACRLHHYQRFQLRHPLPRYSQPHPATNTQPARQLRLPQRQKFLPLFLAALNPLHLPHMPTQVVRLLKRRLHSSHQSCLQVLLSLHLQHSKHTQALRSLNPCLVKCPASNHRFKLSLLS
jgi:hypothetical protein